MWLRAFWLVALIGLAGVPAASRATTVKVDFGTTGQTIRGFGGSTAFQAQLTPAQASALFGNGPGQLGLSLLRVRVDPGGQPNWSTELSNAQQAAALGANVIASIWSPPAAMKTSGSTIGGYLNSASYASFAAYIESYVTYLASNGVNLYGISPSNESDLVLTYESCQWTPAQMHTWFRHDASVITTNVFMPESYDLDPLYSNPTLNDPAAAAHVGFVGGHLYGANQVPAPYRKAMAKGKEVWMTEHFIETPESVIATALSLAVEVNNSMAVGRYSAYVYWWLEYSSTSLIGLADVDGGITTNGAALGQFAKYVRPGYVRSDATVNPAPSVYVSAYKGNSSYVIVAVNAGAGSVGEKFVVKNASVGAFATVVTSETQMLAPGATVPVSNGAFTYTLPAGSITTFVSTAAG